MQQEGITGCGGLNADVIIGAVAPQGENRQVFLADGQIQPAYCRFFGCGSKAHIIQVAGIIFPGAERKFGIGRIKIGMKARRDAHGCFPAVMRTKPETGLIRLGQAVVQPPINILIAGFGLLQQQAGA